MKNKETVRELFCFHPQRFGYNPQTITDVYIIGEFNDWGRDSEKINQYKLIKDKTNRWINVFEVPVGKKPYKFLLSNNTYCPNLSLMYYSTVLTPKWSQKAIWYQIIPDRFFKGNKNIQTPYLISWDSVPDYFNSFGGDLKGIKEKIYYLKELFGSLENVGVYLNPITKSLASNHKYWPEDFEQIDPQFGNEQDLSALIKELHQEKAKIIIDLVYNHSGINHYAFLDILKNGNTSKYINWYRGLPNIQSEKLEIPILENFDGQKPANMQIENDPVSNNFDSSKESFISIWDGKYKFPIINPKSFKNSTLRDIIDNQPYYKLVNINDKPNYKCWADLFEIPELNTKDQTLKQHLFKAARKWIKLGIDGFRLDVPDLLNDAHKFWKEFRQEIKQEAVLNNRNPDDIYIVGELWTNGKETSSFICSSDDNYPIRFDSVMNYPIRENILNFLSEDVLNPACDRVMKEGEISVSELDFNLHNNLSFISWGTIKAQYNVFSSQDTRRLRTALKDDKRLKASLIMQFTLPGAPAVYYGEEIGMEGGEDPQNRATMKWNLVDKIDNYKEEKEIYNLYKKLINIRKNYDCHSSCCYKKNCFYFCF